MVNVASKEPTLRQASACGEILMRPAALKLLKSVNPKGDALAAARIAGIMAAKRTGDLIPLCHSLSLEAAGVDFRFMRRGIQVRAWVKSWGKTGVEMEALTAATVALLTLYDMLKSADRGMVIGRVRLTFKAGGRSGAYERRPRKGRHS